MNLPMSDCARPLARASLTMLMFGIPVIGWAAAEGAVADPLLFDIDLAICSAIVFLLTLLVLRKFAWGPISTGLERREQAIADNIATAENAAEEARKLTAHYEEKLAGAADEVRAIIEEARRDAEHTGQQIVEKAQAKASEEGQRMLREVELAKEGALKEIADRGADLAVDLAGKIVQRELSVEDHANLIQNAQANFSDLSPSDN
jgi:F-type H+-transporting ATPase subunit b